MLDHLKGGIVVSNPTPVMDICVCFHCVFVLSCIQVATLRLTDHSSKESYSLCKEDYGTEEDARAQQRAVGTVMKECKCTDEWFD
jgi:hypothetical protein